MKLTDEQIGAELHALRETPSERFAAELDAWAAEGFPSADQIASRATKGTSRRSQERWTGRIANRVRNLRHPVRLGLVGGAAVVFAIAVATTASLNDYTSDLSDDLSRPTGGGDSGALSGPAPQEGRATEQAPIAAPDVAVPPVPPVPPTEKLKPGQERVQERSASMTLSTESGQVDDVADGVVEVTERYDGIVASSNVSTSNGKGRATFDLRIPSQNLQATLAELSDLADVTSRDEGVLDITAPFISAEERFDDAKAEVDALLDQLAEADSATEIASIREQLRSARGELAAARAELGGLKQRADFSRLSVTVTGDGDGDGWSIGDAAEDSVDVLEALGGAALVTLAVVIPLGGLALLAWFAATRLRQRRRESALDES
jgi:Domain of unknown function (DUF4349)